MATVRFEEGKSYFIQTALHHVTFTVTRRTATRITLSDGKTYRIKEMLGEEYIDMNIFSATVSLCASNIVKQGGGFMKQERFGCQKYPVASCDNCGYSCKDDGGKEQWCEQWMPNRGGHPSTPNPCECSHSYEFDLYLNECAGCPHIKWED